jgi:prepilin peptidase CpaA
MLSPPELQTVGQLLLSALVVAALITDIRSRRIPNWLVLAAIIAGISWNVYSRGLSGLVTAGAGLGIGFVLYIPLYLLRARGAGDVKLLAAVGAIVGPENCVWIFLLTAVLGGVIALAWVVIRGRARQTFFNVSWILGDLSKLRAPYKSSPELDVRSAEGLRLPHALMLAAGATAFLLMADHVPLNWF